MSDPWGNLAALEDHVWARLDRGAREARDPFRRVALATGGEAGPEARMVALRRADRAAREVEVHSDLRTAKVRALRVDPRAAVLAWDEEAQLQVRLRLTVRIVEADLGRWAEVPADARLNYGTDPAPGRPVARPEDVTRTPAPERFAALVGRVEAIDAVSLAHAPHRRAILDADGARWVAP